MTASATAPEKGRNRILIALWVCAVVAVVSSWWVYGRHVMDPEDWVDWVAENLMLASAIYAGILSLRGILLIPSTPLLFAGIVLFPGLWVWTLNMVGILTSSALVYGLVRMFGFDYLVRRKYRHKVRRLSILMQHHAFPVIVGWSFFPAVPTDVIVYTAATLRVSVLRCLAAVGIGEGLLISFYVASGNTLMATLS